MPKRLPLTHEAKARISETTSLKIELYATKNDCSESAVVRKALKNFLHNVSTKGYKKK
jgi:hypothetical protein